jgi:protein SCO1/2
MENPVRIGGGAWRLPATAAALVAAMLLFAACGPEPPPVLAELDSFSLTDQRGETFGSEELAGEIWVANFFFTTCPSICPRLMDVVKGVRDDLDSSGLEDIMVVSISVDPGRDTPERLAEYAGLREIDAARWRLLTGPEEQIESLAERFLLAIGGRTERGPGIYDIAHSAKLVLVDGDGAIRGYFSSEGDGPRRIVVAARQLDRAR